MAVGICYSTHSFSWQLKWSFFPIWWGLVSILKGEWGKGGIKEVFIQKSRQRSSLLLGGQYFLNSLPR